MAEGSIQGRRTGFVVVTDPAMARPHERETFGCGHCQHVTVVEHGQSLDTLGGMCFACMRPCCKVCTALFQRPVDQGGGCDTFEKKIERGELAQRTRKPEPQFHTELELKIRAQVERMRFLDAVEARDVRSSPRM